MYVQDCGSTWEGFDYRRINMEFKSVVNGLFKCDITDDVTKII